MNKPETPTLTNSMALGPPLYSEAARAIFAGTGDQSPAAFSQIMAKGLHSDACRWMAAHFPLRHAVWWGLLCLEDTGAGPAQGATTKNLILRWITDPSDTNRDQIHSQTWENVPASPVDYLAKAVAWSGPTMSAPHLPPVKADPQLPGVLVAAAIETAAGSHVSLDLEKALHRFIQLGLLVDTGKIHWSQPTANADVSANDKTQPQGLFPLN